MACRRAGRVAVVTGVAAALLGLPLGGAVDAATAPLVPVREVRTTWTAELGVPRPAGLTYDAAANELLVASQGEGGASVVRLGFDEEANGRFRIPGVTDADTLAVDPIDGEVTTAGDADAATVDAATGTTYLLDAARREVVRVRRRGQTVVSTTRVPVRGAAAGTLRGLAFNPADRRLYVGVPEARRVHALDPLGEVRKTFSLDALQLHDIAAMTFAPSADRTDAASVQHLYIADPGTERTTGGITEITLAAAPVLAATVVTQTASLVQVIETSRFSPASPDPAGVTYMPAQDRLEIADSEVEETTGAGWHGVNLWQLTRTGAVTDTGTTHPAYSKEPTGLGFDPATGTLFISDDSNDRVWVVKPGPDGRYGNADDLRTSVNARAYGSDDTEDPAFDTVSGVLYFSDAVSTQIYRVDPVNGVFGDGNDTMTQFDVGVHGITDAEGLAFDSARNTLLVGDRSGRRIYEITKANELLRVIDARVSGMRNLSGLTVAPAPGNPSRRDYWIVDRGIDNGPSPTENDGKLFQVSAPAEGTFDPAPAVSITSPADGAYLTGTSAVITANATDDAGVTRVEFFDGTVSLGIDTNGSDGWSAGWPLGADGPHTLRATATDTANQTGTSAITVTVDNSAPTVALTAPASGASVSGTTSVSAYADDPQGVASVTFLLDGTTAIGTDTDGTNGWSAQWNTAGVANGPHALSARAVNRAGLQTTSASVPVTVTNTGGTTVVLDIPVVTGADDIEERSSDGRIDVASTDLDMTLDNTVPQSAIGLRFLGVDIPQGAAITAAYLQFRADETHSLTTNLRINGLVADNLAPFGTAKFSLSTAPRTAAAADWLVAAWIERRQGAEQRSADLSAIVQEIVNRQNWAPGNALGLVVTGSGQRVAKSAETGSAPVLHLEYRTG